MNASSGRCGHAIRKLSTHVPKNRLGKTISLDHFIQRTKTLSFYRTVLRGIGHISNPSARDESKRYARNEFERHRDVTDIGHIRYLLSTGKVEWDNMRRYIGGM